MDLERALQMQKKQYLLLKHFNRVGHRKLLWPIKEIIRFIKLLSQLITRH